MNLLLLDTLAAMVAVPIYGVWGVRYMAQRERDKRYKPTYILTLPSQATNVEQVDDFFCTVHGLVSTAHPFGSAPTMAFELWANDGMKVPRIRIPASLDEDIISQLHSAIPTMRVDLDKEPPRRVWTKIQEFEMRDKERGLQPESPAAASRRITAAFNAVGKTETLLLQWVITGAGRRQLPQPKETTRSKFSVMGAIYGNSADNDEIKERRGKESELIFKATLRVAVVADTRDRADKLAARVRNALAPTGTAYTHFRRRKMLSTKQLQDRVDYSTGSTSWPNRLTISEFIRVCGWPVDSLPGVGFAPGRGMDLAPTATLVDEGIQLGVSTYPGQQRPVFIDYLSMLRHFLVLGKIGKGKSELMASMARQIMDAGHGLILLEISGDLHSKILDYVPQSRFEDVIVLDMADQQFPIPFNILDQGSRSAAVDDLYTLLEYKMGGARGMGVWASEVLYHGLQTIAETPGLSFFDILALLDPQTSAEKSWSNQVIAGLQDDELKRWWAAQGRERAKSDWSKKVEPVRSRMWQFISRPELRNIMGQSKSAFTWQEVLLENKILLISFKGVPEDAVSLACAMFMQSLWKAIKSTKKDTLSFLMLDESAEFMDLPINLQKILEQARKHRVSTIMAAQQLDQFNPPSLQRSVLQNMNSRVVFDTFSDDANAMRRETGVEASYFINQPDHEAIAHIKTPGGMAPPVTIHTLPPDYERIKNNMSVALIEQSRKLYGTPINVVHREIENRRRPPGYQPPEDRPRPPLSGAGWDV